MSADGSGDCNVVVYLLKNPQIYDVFRVRVSSMVKPFSPVHVHVGGTVQFKITDQDGLTAATPSNENIWSSNQPHIMDINARTGLARALFEGKSEILISNNINAASLVHVSRVRHAEIDQASRKGLMLNTDEKNSVNRIKLRLFLADSAEEVAPTVQFDGVTLINNNVGLVCESDQPTLISAEPEVNELEGFFCVVTLKNPTGQKAYPKSTTITVSAYGMNSKDPRNIKAALYVEKLLTFDVALLSKIRVEQKYRDGVNLYNDLRTVSVRIYSTVPFNTFLENKNAEDEELVKFKVSKASEESNEYALTVTVPQEINHSFGSSIHLVHPITNAKVEIPIKFLDKTQGPYYHSPPKVNTPQTDFTQKGEDI
jgi:hypothetical protein